MKDIRKIKELLRGMMSADIEIVIREAVLELRKKSMYEAVQNLMSIMDKKSIKEKSKRVS